MGIQAPRIDWKLMAIIAVAVALAFGCKNEDQGGTEYIPSVYHPPEPPVTQFPDGVTVRLSAVWEATSPISFGVPLAKGNVADVSTVRVFQSGTQTAPEGLKIKPLLYYYDENGLQSSVRAILVQFNGTIEADSYFDLDIHWSSTTGEAPPSDVLPVSPTRHESPESVTVTDRTMVENGGVYSFRENNTRQVTRFDSFEPCVIPLFPESYLADSGILGPLMSKEQVASKPNLAGLAFVGENLKAFSRSFTYNDGYAYAPASVNVPKPELENDDPFVEGWLYDPCATLLLANAYETDVPILRSAMRHCAYYADNIDEDGLSEIPHYDDKESLSKYSHMRGLFAYYAMTGDETALAAMRRIRTLWRNDPTKLVEIYGVGGHIEWEGPLWTERVLGAGLEGLIYGYFLDGNKDYFDAFVTVFETAYLHITTTDQNVLREITLTDFPPQDCFIHSAHQHSESIGNENTDLIPWCSGWMQVLLVDGLLRYQETSGDSQRVDEVFIQLARFMRDVGSTYVQGDTGDYGDTFLEPEISFTGSNSRLLVPVYGAGLNASSERILNNTGKSDRAHCADALAVTSTAIAGLSRYSGSPTPIGPFDSEAESLEAMHHELAYCAVWIFDYYVSGGRLYDPRNWTSDLIGSHYNPDPNVQAAYLTEQRVGYPANETDPRRKFSWWFNMSMFQYKLLDEAGADFSIIEPGQVP